MFVTEFSKNKLMDLNKIWQTNSFCMANCINVTKNGRISHKSSGFKQCINKLVKNLTFLLKMPRVFMETNKSCSYWFLMIQFIYAQ